MRVRFTRDMGNYQKGEVHDLHPSLARRAVQINRATHVETTTQRPPEHAAKRTRPPGEEPTACGAEKATGGTCQRQTDGGRCWQHEED